MLKTNLLHSIYLLPGFGETSLRKVATGFERAEDILSATREDFRRLGIGAKATHLFFDRKNSLDPERDWETLKKQNIDAYSQGDAEYPTLLAEISDAPPLLYVRGNVSILSTRPCVAIVGTRKPTDYGRHVARTLARELAGAGVVVVSGLALGLDAEAHLGALDAKGLTAAILGGGVAGGRIAPRTNLDLARKIVATGGVVASEFPPDTEPTVGTFPMRNRVIAGLSRAVVVVEAGEKSGTLITARLALEYNRDVFAVPGSILSPLSQGANRLIKNGAVPVTCTQDILDTLALSQSAALPASHAPTHDISSLSPEDRLILNLLSTGPATLQELANKTPLPPATLATHLTLLEIQGQVKDIGGGKYIQIQSLQ